MSYDQPQTAPPAPEAPPQQYPPQQAYVPPKPKRKPEEIISNGLILAVTLFAGILILISAILVHATGFLDDSDLIKNITIVSKMLVDVAMFLIVVFMVLTAIMRSDVHHWVRASLVVLGALVLLIFLSVVLGSGFALTLPYP
jgi:magnesium-transporting ATPase (P-type)